MTTQNRELRKKEGNYRFMNYEPKDSTLISFVDSNQKKKNDGWEVFDEFDPAKIEEKLKEEKGIERNSIINDDCLNVLMKLPDNYIDLCLTDPPYGDGVGYGRNKKEILNNENETINYKFLDLIYKKMKNNTSLYLFTNWKFEFLLRDYIQKKTKFNMRMLLIILKNNFGLGYGFRNQYEVCLVLEKGNPKYKLNNFSNVLKMDYIPHDINTHPHTKALNILKRILEHSSEEGDLVFDGFIGSGSTIEACIEMKRDYIGVELDKKWFDLINNRLNKEPKSI